MKKRICSNCGESNPSSNYTCSNCNSSLSRAMVVTVEKDANTKPDTKKCPRCGVICKSTAFSCVRCGAYLVNGEKPSSSLRKASTLTSFKSHNDNTLLYVMSFIIPLVGFISGAILLTSDDDYKRHDGKVCLLVGLSSSIIIGIVASIIASSATNAIL